MPFHESKKGVLKPCNAQPGNCPLGGKHYDTLSEGYADIEKRNSEEFGNLGSVNNTPKTKEPMSRELKINIAMAREKKFLETMLHNLECQQQECIDAKDTSSDEYHKISTSIEKTKKTIKNYEKKIDTKLLEENNITIKNTTF